MDVGRRRRTTARNGVVAAAGSVWGSRMKTEEFKVFNGDESSEDNNEKKSRPKQSPPPRPPGAGTGKRKTWKSANSEANPVQIAAQRSEPNKGSNECKELIVSGEGIKRSPVQRMKTRPQVAGEGNERSSPVRKMKLKSEENRDLHNVFVERPERNPIQMRKAKSESQKLICQAPVESGDADGMERNSVQLRKTVGESADGNARNPIPLTNAKVGVAKNLQVLSDETKRSSNGSNKVVGETLQEIEKNPIEIENARSEEDCKVFVVCEEKTISSGLNRSGQVNSAPTKLAEAAEPEEEEEEDYGVSCDDEEEYWDEEESDEEVVDEEIEIKAKAKSFDVKEINTTELKTKQVLREVKRLHQVQEKPLPISPIVKKQASASVNHSRTHPLPTKTKAVPAFDVFQRVPETHAGFKTSPHPHSKLQSLVDLVMWRDVSKSTFVFGVGTFLILSLSYTQDINFSFISVVSYLGLVYLAAIFIFRSVINRGDIDTDHTRQCYVIGEEEAVWLLELVLPYLNEFLVKLGALFSGDPATTMKLAGLLFVLAKCGSSITIWKMAKLGFFGAFIIPKLCSSYSTQLTAYGKFWVRRFKDAWESCSHKKAVAFGIFTLVWNLSSVVARMWAVFMLYVAFRYYQQSIVSDDWVEEEPEYETSLQAQSTSGGVRAGGTTKVETKRKKKTF